MKIVVLTGAGISAESGIKTFRDADGLWEGHDVMEVATPQGWAKNKALVLEFYNQRRRQLHEVQPNAAHYALADLAQRHEVQIITQNVDDLHERAGSTQVMHLHGELFKVRSTLDPSLVYERKGDLNLGDKCEKGSQLRPHIVWFGEDVPLIYEAEKLVEQADLLFIIGTSLVVYPAAGLMLSVKPKTPIYYIDPNPAAVSKTVRTVVARATEGVPQLIKELGL